MDDRFTEDPEVAADRELRERTARERPAMPLERYEWLPAPAVEHWPCTRCGSMVGVSAEGVHAAKVFDDELRSRGEAPRKRTAIVWCSKCRLLRDEHGQRIAHKQRTNLATVIRELKEDPGAERERELLEQCRHLLHPDIDGLTLWLKERRERQSNARPGKRRL